MTVHYHFVTEKKR